MPELALVDPDLAKEPIIAPDGSHIWLMTRVDSASSIHMRLGPGEVSRAQRHATVSELWFFVEGVGQLWREGTKPGSTEPATRFGCRDTQTGAPLKLG